MPFSENNSIPSKMYTFCVDSISFVWKKVPFLFLFFSLLFIRTFFWRHVSYLFSISILISSISEGNRRKRRKENRRRGKVWKEEKNKKVMETWKKHEKKEAFLSMEEKEGKSSVLQTFLFSSSKEELSPLCINPSISFSLSAILAVVTSGMVSIQPPFDG